MSKTWQMRKISRLNEISKSENIFPPAPPSSAPSAVRLFVHLWENVAYTYNDVIHIFFYIYISLTIKPTSAEDYPLLHSLRIMRTFLDNLLFPNYLIVEFSILKRN